jgi:alkylation response protein AidB-like acyl-CoA dehydrogenase
VIAALLKGGSDAQCATWLPAFLAGDAFGTLAFAEGDQALDPAGIRTTAKKTRDGWQLSGTKVFVQDAPGADVLLVAARTKAGTGPAGVSLFLVERRAKASRCGRRKGSTCRDAPARCS